MWKYGVSSNGWWTKDVRGSHGVGLWKAIMQGLNDFKEEIGFKVGDGSRVSFWKEVGCSNLLLMNEFPSLFEIPQDKNALVKDYLVVNSGAIFWNVTFSRHFNDWELESVLLFYQVFTIVRFWWVRMIPWCGVRTLMGYSP